MTSEVLSQISTITITLPDNSEKTFSQPITGFEITKTIGKRLFESAIACKIDGVTKDLSTLVKKSARFEVITDNSKEGLDIIRHSTAHIMADAVQRLFPGAKITIGPVIENGFFYDFDTKNPFTEEDLLAIEKEMQKVIDGKHDFCRKEISQNEALSLWKEQGEKYKLEIVSEFTGEEVISLYSHGSFTDLCRGPHVPNTSKIKAFKLLNVAGAYWRGDERNQMLQRIYGTAWADKKSLDDYLHKLEEAAKRDHRKLGQSLELFSLGNKRGNLHRENEESFYEEVGPGLVLWHPKGALIRSVIEDFWRKKHRQNGYEFLYTPHIAKSDLWKVSGHWGFYRENMFSPIDIEGQEYLLKPMNCPFHIMVYKDNLRSYKQLPFRFAEFGTVYRYERSGVLHGLMRVRGFTQDDAHLFVTKEQLETEIQKVIQFTFGYLKTFGFHEFEVYLSTRPEKFVGEQQLWEQAQSALRLALSSLNISFEVDEGGGAFYGPKIDIKIKDSIERLWQCSTIQLDFNLPERFDLSYIGQDGEKHRPFMIHRALMGSLERFFGILIEHYAGAFPGWLAHEQVRIIPITEKHVEFAQKLKDHILHLDYRAGIDLRNEKLGLKIREAQIEKVPYMFIIGDNEIRDQNISVRKHGEATTVSLGFSQLEFFLKEKFSPPMMQ